MVRYSVKLFPENSISGNWIPHPIHFASSLPSFNRCCSFYTCYISPLLYFTVAAFFRVFLRQPTDRITLTKPIAVVICPHELQTRLHECILCDSRWVPRWAGKEQNAAGGHGSHTPRHSEHVMTKKICQHLHTHTSGYPAHDDNDDDVCLLCPVMHTQDDH